MTLLEQAVDFLIRKGIQAFTPLGYFVSDEKEKWITLFCWYIANTFFFGLFLYQHPDYLSYLYSLAHGPTSYVAYVANPIPFLTLNFWGLFQSYGVFILGFVLSPFIFLTYHPRATKVLSRFRFFRKISHDFRLRLRRALTVVGVAYCAVLFSYQITSVDYQSIQFYQKGVAYLIPVVLVFSLYWVKREGFEHHRIMTAALIAKLWATRIVLLAFLTALVLFYITFFIASANAQQIIPYLPHLP